MTNLEIDRDEFPHAVPVDAKVGDLFTFTITGRIINIGAEMIDVSGVRGREYVPGAISTRILVSRII